ncbi:Aspartyl-tRNA(Asn) amidotransferase subunit A Glutamyl-tRNA(Gln) amidotransferase subunit A [Paramagnetospirillum magnetotacticum MS-1]|uniref:Glutamyl-tRNA(Gln) amidotransferase subunit A n=1 Tax=Paramagnetospirillum magnetotacticum MS-1 TaxID=272627 RepID=A0A0C2UFF1_PARME|nr:Asp-tRNA(Asn)/Glu-tRNA(Gln) amidotransferase subunit GatA [Paramagnetospirillum magnetotacticum]KIM00243.1 Aspartyl-tRNA(Asn) amidotransferase subunit A Glutamyl-tRNA(Gln) amidotransferase subunit A [Paramagnetospirillum magnetotacticum MS-1]
MTKLTDLTMAEARDGLAKGAFTAVELTSAHIKATEAQRHLNAFIVETPDLALDAAKASDARRQAGTAGSMDGLPIGIKDLFCTEGVQTTAASHILEGFKPPYESTVSGKLKAAGAVSLGKLNLDEFAMGSSNQTSYFGAVENPWKKTSAPKAKLVPGGSSGGSAAAVAARMVMAATGTDTGGSIRQPAAFCGITGIKPTYGRCSRFGIVAFASSLDQAGPMARTVRDCAIMLGAMAGHDPKDSTSVNMAVPDFEKALTGDIRGLKVGIPKEYRPDGLSDEVAKVWELGIEWIKAAGATPVEISLPHTKYALPTYYIIAPAECSSNLARYDGLRFGLRVPGKTLDEMYKNTRAAGFGAEVRRRILIGTYVLSAGYYDAYYAKAQKVRRLIAEDFRKAFESVDIILTPTAPSAAFGQGEGTDDPVTMWLNDVFTIPTSMAGLPGLSLPAGLSKDGLPLGLQLIGRPFDEETVFRVAGVMETAANFTAKPEGI